jgi:hypothetical protein
MTAARLVTDTPELTVGFSAWTDRRMCRAHVAFVAGDIAILELLEPLPDGVSPADLRYWNSRESALRAYGHPDGTTAGGYLRGFPRGSAGGQAVRVQLDDGRDGWPVASGFLGAGVATADEVGEAVGIVVPAGGAHATSGAMLPMEAVLSYWPPLGRLIDAAASRRPDGGRRSVAMWLLPHFAAVPALTDAHSRELIVAELRPDIRRSADRHVQANFDILGILQACLRFPGGLAELVDVVRVFEHGSAEMAELDTAMRELPPGSVR